MTAPAHHLRAAIALAFGLLGGAGCNPSMIPGTQIADTGDNRELLKQVELFRQAIERKDAPAILGMIAPGYYDTRGHPDDPLYHWNFDRVRSELPERFAQVKDLRLDITPRRIEVKRDHAKVSYLFTQNFMAQMPAGEVAKHESDMNLMEFQRVDGRWLITRGL